MWFLNETLLVIDIIIFINTQKYFSSLAISNEQTKVLDNNYPKQQTAISEYSITAGIGNQWERQPSSGLAIGPHHLPFDQCPLSQIGGI